MDRKKSATEKHTLAGLSQISSKRNETSFNKIFLHCSNAAQCRQRNKHKCTPGPNKSHSINIRTENNKQKSLQFFWFYLFCTAPILWCLRGYGNSVNKIEIGQNRRDVPFFSYFRHHLLVFVYCYYFLLALSVAATAARTNGTCESVAQRRRIGNITVIVCFCFRSFDHYHFIDTSFPKQHTFTHRSFGNTLSMLI